MNLEISGLSWRWKGTSVMMLHLTILSGRTHAKAFALPEEKLC